MRKARRNMLRRGKPAMGRSRLKLVAGLVLVLAFTGSGVAQTSPFYDVKGYGAAGNGVALDTSAINQAIRACHAAGGGTVHFPAGTYRTGTLHLKDNVTLWLDAGSTILGSKSLAHYDTPLEGQPWFGALILGKSVHNVAILGPGTIDGNKVFNPEGETRMRGPHAVLLYDCKDITVRSVSFKDAGNYALILRSCERVNVDGITASGGWDGINMHDTKNATISNCRLFTGDDCLSGAYWENVTVTNCVLNTSCNAMRVGGRNVLISNCLVYGPGEHETKSALRRNLEGGFLIVPHQALAAQEIPNRLVPPGPVDNMIISNVSMINVRSPVWVASACDAPYCQGSLGIGRIIVNNLTVTGAGKAPFYVSGSPAAPVKSFVVNNARMTFAGGANERQANGQGLSSLSIPQSYGFYFRNVENIELHDVRVGYGQPDLRPALFGENIGTLDVDRFVPQRDAEGAPPFLLAGIRQMLVNGKEAATSKARIKGLQVDAERVVAGEPFPMTVTVENAGPEGLAEVLLRLDKQTLARSVWLKAGEMARVHFVNLRCSDAGERQAEAGEILKKFAVLPRTERLVAAPYRAFQNIEAQLRQLGDDAFYIRASADHPLIQYGDQYGSIYLPAALSRNGAVVVKLENPDLRTYWGGRTGIMVRNDISQPGRAGGYVILAASPSNGYSLEWDADGDGRIDRHTEFDGYTLWPHWLRLERRGNSFTGYSSINGKSWTRVGEAVVPGTEELLDAGLFAHRGSARFEGFQVSSQPLAK